MRKPVYAMVMIPLCFFLLNHAAFAAPAKNNAYGKKLTVTSNKSTIDSTNQGPVELTIRVGLLKGRKAVSIGADMAFVVRDINSGMGLRKVDNGKLEIISKGGGLHIGGKAIAGKRILLKSANRGRSAIFDIDGNKYRGEIEIAWKNGSFSIINIIPVDEYLMGVVPQEMSPSWPIEALKAQAVAARTFALKNRGRHDAEGFDVCTSTHCQAYAGESAESSRSDEAVRLTRGKVITYNGELIESMFHTDSGGMTENSENVWGSKLPYLRSVKELKEKTMPWQQKYALKEVQARLLRNGHDIGRIRSIELSPLTIGMKSSDRTQSGRVSVVRFHGERGTVAISGENMRSIFGLKSTLFDIKLETFRTPRVKVHISTPDDRRSRKPGRDSAIGLEGLPNAEETQADSRLRQLSGEDDENIVFFGYGWGHGLGMSQHGAKAYADSGMKYDHILSHYYTGTVVGKYKDNKK